MSRPFLELNGITTQFDVRPGLLSRRRAARVKAVDGVSLRMQPGEVLGLVGESGCGKTTLARTVLQLIPAAAGKVRLEGRDLTGLTDSELREARADFQMIFQDPYSSLNPRMTVYDTLAEAVRVRSAATDKDDTRDRVLELVEAVGLRARDMSKYPHEFSGGQRQRIAIARALAPQPKLIVADEPVSALDVSIQSQIINLIQRLSRERGLTLIFISHDLSVVRYLADRIAVMYLGRIVEVGDAAAIMETPVHPYTKALISAIPIPDPDRERQRRRVVLTGDPPSPINPPTGCSFHPRCSFADSSCSQTVPELEATQPGREVACLRIDEVE